MDLSELQLNRNLYRTQPQTVETLGADAVASNLSPAPSTALASGNSVTDVNTNAETIDGSSITPGTIPPATLDVSNWGWTQTCAFTSASATQVNWGVGTFVSANGVSYAISAGNTGAMAAKTYIYLDLNISSTAYQHTTTSANAVGVGKVLVAVAQNASVSATFNLNVATQIVGDNIVANTIDASKIVAGTITATQISASYVYAGTISADNVTAGTLTGSIVRTSSGNDRVQMTVSSNSLGVYGSNVLRISLAQDSVTFFNSSGTTIGGIRADTTATVIDAAAGKNITLSINGSAYFGASGSFGYNISSVDMHCDTDLYVAGTTQYRSVAQPVLYFGYCSSTTISKTNTSFTLTNPSTGKYTISHNFGTTNYTAVTTALRASGAGAYSSKVEALNTNSLQVTIFDDTGTVQNSDFMFLITKI